MLEDILEESWAYQEIVKKGLDQGLQLGLKEGLQQGLQQGLQLGLQQGLQQGIREQRHAVMSMVQRLFPELTSFAQPRVEAINNTETLRLLLDEIVVAQTTEQVKQAIMNARVEE